MYMIIFFEKVLQIYSKIALLISLKIQMGEILNLLLRKEKKTWTLFWNQTLYFFCLHSDDMFDHQEVKVSSELRGQQTEKFALPLVEYKVLRRRQTQSVCGVINHQDRGEGSRRGGKYTHVVSSGNSQSPLDRIYGGINKRKLQLCFNSTVKIRNKKHFLTPFRKHVEGGFCRYVKQLYHCCFKFYFNATSK